MSTARIRLVLDLEIYDGKFAEFEAIAKQMVAASEQEPGTLAGCPPLSAVFADRVGVIVPTFR